MTESLAPVVMAENKAFSKHVQFLQLAWDSTSIGALKTCARYYQYNIIFGYSTKAENVHLVFGLHLHSIIEHYYHCRAEGFDHKTAIESATLLAAELTFNKELGRPWFSDEPTKNRLSLIRAIVWYLDKFEHDNMQTVILKNGKPAVELSFRHETGLNTDLTGEEYLLCGHLDRVVYWNDNIWGLDHKAQPLTAKVLTDKGWINIGTLKVGDEIAGKDGNFVKVKGIYPKGKTDAYEITFNDDSCTTCAGDHLWQVSENNDFRYWKIINFKDLIPLIKSGRDFAIPTAQAIKHTEKVFALHPYVLGALLGDGYLCGGNVSISSSNEELITKINSFLPDEEKFVKSPAENLVWYVLGGRNSKTFQALAGLGLIGKLSGDKFIPQEYLFGSVEQRQALLQGLLDTDGSWDRQYLRYQTTSLQLAKAVCDLVRSLGGYANFNYQSAPNAKTGIRFRVNIRMSDTPSGIKARYPREIKKLEDTETVCIEVDSTDGLYLTDNYIVTHNTTKSAMYDDFFQKYSPDNQVSLYMFSGQVVLDLPMKGFIIDGIQVGATFARFQRGTVTRTKAQLNEWFKDLQFWLRQAEMFAEQEYYPMNEKSCSNYGGCPYRQVCGASPEARPQLLQHLYHRRVWDPLTAR